MLDWFAGLNTRKPYADPIKPHNFVLVARVAPTGYPQGSDPINAPFAISLERHQDAQTTHIHRPLEFYWNIIFGIPRNVGLYMDKTLGLRPSKEAERKYPEPWHYARYPAVKCISLLAHFPNLGAR